VFNVCPGCGQYRVDKDVLAGAAASVSMVAAFSGLQKSVAICPECSFGMPFLQMPLLVVTGASGTGKSTVLLSLLGQQTDFVCLDSDILWRDEFNSAADDYSAYRNLWLRVVKNIAQSGRPVALFGSATPGQFARCEERRYVGDIHYLALICDDDELERRLKARPGWRKSGSEDVVSGMKQFNTWLRENASSTGMATLDTTKMDIDATAKATLQWMHDSISKAAGRR
jgi:hypothetical protein